MRPYSTVSTDARVEFVINKSRFIGWCSPVDTETGALSLLEDVKKRHRDATHNCYAYSIGPAGGAARFSDDGEPGGTAGMPMMEVIRHKGVTNLLCVVTRYFGGVLLGAGGLVRAYSRAASEAVEAAGPIRMRPCVIYAAECDYGRWGALEPVLMKHGTIVDTAYTDRVTVRVAVLEEECRAFEKAVRERTDGRVAPLAGESVYRAFPMGEGDRLGG